MIRRKLKPGWAGAMVAALALVVAGCDQGEGGSSPEPSGPQSEPVKGGTLIYADVKPMPSAQTQWANWYQVNNVLNSMLDRLLYFDKKTGELVPWIAESYTSNDDATQYTLTIRDGVTFSDGSPLDAEVVKKNLDLQAFGDEAKQIPANPTFKAYKSSSVSGNTVTVELSKPDAFFPRSLSNVQAGLVSAGTMELGNEGQSSLKTIVGSGPFVFESEIPEQEVVLKRRDDYAWPPASFDNQGPAYLDKVIIRILGEVGLRAGAVQSGQVDVVRNVQPSDEDLLAAGGFQVVGVTAPELTGRIIVARPTPGSPLNELAVRQALQIGFDRQGMAQTVLTDSYTIASSILSKESPDWVDLSADLKYDPERAAQLLDDAGWVLNEDGVREKDGKELELTLAASTASVVAKPAAEYIAQQWSDLGIRIENRAGDDAFFGEAYADPEKAGLQFINTFVYYTGFGPEFGSGNVTGRYSDAELDDLYAQASQATDPAEQLALAQEAQRVLVVEKAGAIPLYDEILVHAMAPNVHLGFTGAAAPIFQEAWKAE